MWRKNSKKDVALRLLKSRKRKLKKAAAKEEVTEATVAAFKKELKEYRVQVSEMVRAGDFDAKYNFSPLASHQLGNKTRSFYIWRKSPQGNGDEYRVIIGYNNNSLELWGMKVAPKTTQEEGKAKKGETLEVHFKKIQELGWWGHQTPIRVCMVSGNDQLLLTASTGN